MEGPGVLIFKQLNAMVSGTFKDNKIEGSAKVVQKGKQVIRVRLGYRKEMALLPRPLLQALKEYTPVLTYQQSREAIRS